MSYYSITLTLSVNLGVCLPSDSWAEPHWIDRGKWMDEWMVAIVTGHSELWHYSKNSASGRIHSFYVGLYHTWHLGFTKVSPELWIIILHFTTTVISTPSQHIGCDYHILLPHNCVIMTNESSQCAILLFPSHWELYLQAADLLWSCHFALVSDCSWVELERGSGG